MHGHCWLHKFSRKWRKAVYALSLQNFRELKSSSQSASWCVCELLSSPSIYIIYKKGTVVECAHLVCDIYSSLICITHRSSILYHSSPIYIYIILYKFSALLQLYCCTTTILSKQCFDFYKELMLKSVNMSFRGEGEGPKELLTKALSLRQLRWISICTWWTIYRQCSTSTGKKSIENLMQWYSDTILRLRHRWYIY
jgi:hypothetical protein